MLRREGLDTCDPTRRIEDPRHPGPAVLTTRGEHGLVDDADLGRWLLVVFSVVVAIVLVFWARKADRNLLAAALGLVMGGAIGNAIDRARFGAVVDFIDVSRLYFPWVFNIADSGITIGVVLLLLDSLRRETKGVGA